MGLGHGGMTSRSSSTFVEQPKPQPQTNHGYSMTHSRDRVKGFQFSVYVSEFVIYRL